jgi:hypothetical protein
MMMLHGWLAGCDLYLFDIWNRSTPNISFAVTQKQQTSNSKQQKNRVAKAWKRLDLNHCTRRRDDLLSLSLLKRNCLDMIYKVQSGARIQDSYWSTETLRTFCAIWSQDSSAYSI